MAKHVNAAPLSRRYGQRLAVLLIAVVLVFAVIYITSQLTAQRIAHNEREWFAAQINSLVPATLHDNDLLDDRTTVIAPESLGTQNPVTVYRARRGGLPVAAVINSVAPNGYGGPIELLVAINYDGEVLGVRILAHHETPGIGNAFEFPGSKWLDAFKKHSLQRPDTAGWNVRKEGGEFEQFTSATITPRAIIKAVQRTLDYYQRNRDQIYASATSP